MTRPGWDRDRFRAARDTAAALGSAVRSRFAAGPTLPAPPSWARPQPPPSPLLAHLRRAARIVIPSDEPDTDRQVAAVLTTLLERLPAGDRRHISEHLPADVRALTHAPHGCLAELRSIRTVTEFALAVASEAGIVDVEQARRLSIAVLGGLRDLVPEDSDEVAADLPGPLVELWRPAARPAHPAQLGASNRNGR